jgi:hypothetical protein
MNEELTMACILACQNCAASCEHCAVTCSLSPSVNSLQKPLELSIYCADLCRLTATFLQRGELQSLRFCALCAEICDICAVECELHDNAACKACAIACRKCAEECRKIASLATLNRVEDSTLVKESA